MSEPVLKWMRYGVWSAHLHVDGKQFCKIKHGNFSLSPKPLEPREPEEVTKLTPHGVPFGKSCALCLREWERRKHPKKPTSPPAPKPPSAPAPAPRTRRTQRAERLLRIAREIELLEQRIASKEREFQNLLKASDD